MSEPFQEQVAQLRRTQILAAAITVFAEQGFHRTTIRDVAKLAGVADGTIYNYFENKTGLLLAILDTLNQTEQREIDLSQVRTTDVRPFFRAYFAQRWAVFDNANLNVLRIVLSEILVDAELRTQYNERIIAPTFALAEPYFVQLAAAGKLRPLDMPLTLRIISATFIGLLMLRMLDDTQVAAQWEAVPDLLTTLLLDGMLLNEGGLHGPI